MTLVLDKNLENFIKFSRYKLKINKHCNAYIGKYNWPVESKEENDKNEILVVDSQTMMQFTDYNGLLINKEIEKTFKNYGFQYYWCFNWKQLFFIKLLNNKL